MTLLLKSKLEKKIPLGNDHFLLWLYSPEVAKASKPGQFVMVESGQYLPRPFSICEVQDNQIGIMFKIFGKGTEHLSNLDPGASIGVHGPLGKGFSFPEKKDKAILIVAGGIGIAAFPYVARKAFELGFKVKTLFGARTKGDLVFVDELKRSGEVEVITDDKGFVTELLESELKKSTNQEVLVCGPTPMLNASIDVCRKYNVVAQVSFEEHMACGYGVCMSCVVKVNGKYTRTCIEGPVLRSDILGD